MTDTQQSKLGRGAAAGITGVVAGIAIHDQITSGSVDSTTIGALVVLAAFWLGRTVDWLGKS